MSNERDVAEYSPHGGVPSEIQTKSNKGDAKPRELPGSEGLATGVLQITVGFRMGSSAAFGVSPRNVPR